MRYLIPFLVAATPVWAECPAAPDITEALDEIIAHAQAADTYMRGRDAFAEMWALWNDAPDAQAQEWMELGYERIRIADQEGAEKAFNLVVEYCPNYAEGWNQRAYAKFLREDYEGALGDLERALELTPKHVAALSGKAVTLMKLGREDEGQAVLREAVLLYPWLPERGLLKEPVGAPL